MKTLKIICISLFVFFSTGKTLLWAQSPEQQLEAGNQYYNEANYEEAINTYLHLLSQGYTSDVLLYNTGNAYFKLKDIPSAILYYEKALKLNPAHEDIQHNLQVANSMIVDKIEVIPEIFFRVWWKTFYNMMSANGWAWVSVIFFLLTLAAIYLYLSAAQTSIRKISFFGGILLIFMTIATFGLASQKYYYTREVNEAIIFVPTITAKSSPAQSSVDLFVLHEGTKVALLDQTSGWTKIKIANGSVGWLPDSSFRGI